MNLENILEVYKGKKVFITGHTGFKGAWLALWLHRLGSEVMGAALAPATEPSLYLAAGIKEILCADRRININDYAELYQAVHEFQPEIVIHLAAQALVRSSYERPIETLETNIVGTAKLLEACRQTPSVRAIVVVTSDKCYRNNEWLWGYREEDPLGGDDPYSASKACAELVCNAYVRSFFSPSEYGRRHNIALARARAGNAIGGGDWAKDRLIPDFVRAISDGEPVRIRYPEAVRPWQHVLECLSGYLYLGALLVQEGVKFNGAWNFSPLDPGNCWSVRRVAERICDIWPGSRFSLDVSEQAHEAHMLALDCTKSNRLLGWRPRWNTIKAIDETISWYKFWKENPSVEAVRAFTISQIDAYTASPALEI